MGRSVAEYADIASLRLAVKILEEVAKLAPISEVGHATYIRKMHEYLSKMSIVKQTSTGQVMKIVGTPYSKTLENVGGLALSVLNKIASEVLKFILPKDEFSSIATDIHWAYFMQRISDPPMEARKLNRYGYYKYFENEVQRNIIDNFVMLRMGQWGIDKDIKSFVISLWSLELHSVRNSLVQINRRTRQILYSYLIKDGDGWEVRAKFHGDASKGQMIHTPHISIFSLTDDDEVTNYSQISLYLQASESGLYTSELIDGFLLIPTSHGKLPVSFKVIMQPMESFSAALVKILNQDVSDQVFFNLINKNYRLSSDLSVAANPKRIYALVDKVKGSYYCGYIATTTSPRNGALIIGIAHFGSDGLVKIQVNHSEPLISYIDNEFFYGENLLHIRPLLKNSDEPFKISYSLQLEYEYIDFTPRLKSLTGKTTGFRDNVVIGGSIKFIKIHDKEYESFENLRENIRPKEIRKSDGEKIKHLDKEILALFDYFKDEIL